MTLPGRQLIPREGSIVGLRPAVPPDYQFLYSLATDSRLSHRWRFTGYLPSYETFAAGLWQDVLLQLLVYDLRSGESLGVSVAYSADFANGYASFGAVLKEDCSSMAAIEACALTLNYMFRTWPFRKVYAEVAEYNLPQFQSALGRLFELEGALRDHQYLDGHYWTKYYLAMHRRNAEAHLYPLVDRFLRRKDRRTVGTVRSAPAEEVLEFVHVQGDRTVDDDVSGAGGLASL